jgi:ABC-2 type transport system ATP-binding protein
MEAAIQTHALRKTFGSYEAVRGLNLTVPIGSVCAFLGQNGAGKSSTVRMLLGMIRPTSGTGEIFGLRIDDERESRRIRERVAFVSEDKKLYEYMTVEQILRFTRNFFPKWRHDLERRLLAQFELPLSRKIHRLSKGMRTKLALLLGIARCSELLILDEPTEGLDPVAAEEVLQILVSSVTDGTTVFFSSHQIAEVEQIADHILMIDRGLLVLDASMDEIIEQYRLVEAVFTEPMDERDFRMPGIEKVRATGRTVSMIASSNVEAIAERARLMRARNVDVIPLSLKDLFLETVKEGRA